MQLEELICKKPIGVLSIYKVLSRAGIYEFGIRL